MGACTVNNPITGPVSGSVIVIGAGAAGCYAAYTLAQHGVDVTVLEAMERAGGRVGKHTGFADFDIDLGAQWLHGTNTRSAELAEASNTETFRDSSTSRYWYRGGLTLEKPSAVRQGEAALGEGNFDRSYLDHFARYGCGDDEYHIITSLAADVGGSPELSLIHI